MQNSVVVLGLGLDSEIGHHNDVAAHTSIDSDGARERHTRTSPARGTPSTRQWQAEAGMSSPKSRLKKPAWSRSTRMFHEEIK